MNRPDVSFSSDGTLKNVELKIMNLRPGLSSNLVWEEIGVWKSYEEDNAGLDIKDIVWPGHSHVPPQVRRNEFGTASIRVALVSQYSAAYLSEWFIFIYCRVILLKMGWSKKKPYFLF